MNKIIDSYFEWDCWLDDGLWVESNIVVLIYSDGRKVNYPVVRPVIAGNYLGVYSQKPVEPNDNDKKQMKDSVLNYLKFYKNEKITN